MLVQGSEDSGKPGNFRYVEKRDNKGMQPHPSQLVSTLFLVGKKNGAKRLVINLKKLNRLMPYQHFKMEGLYQLGYMLQQGDYMCKLDMKGVYFSVALHRNCRDKVCF